MWGTNITASTLESLDSLLLGLGSDFVVGAGGAGVVVGCGGGGGRGGGCVFLVFVLLFGVIFGAGVGCYSFGAVVVPQLVGAPFPFPSQLVCVSIQLYPF